MVDASNCEPSVGQPANSKFLGPGCNGWFKPYEKLLLFAHPDQWNRRGKSPRPAASIFVREEQSSDWNALKSPQQVLDERPRYGVVALTISQCVARGQTVKYTPRIDCQGKSVNPAHCDIVDDKEGSIDGSLQTALWFARQCAVLIPSEKDRPPETDKDDFGL